MKSFLEVEEKLFGNIIEKGFKENYEGQEIYVIKCPKGRNFSFSEEILQKINKNNINHLCSTKQGSSGSVIYETLNFKVLGICIGESNHEYIGILISFPIIEFNKKYKNIINEEKKITRKTTTKTYRRAF